MSLEDRINEEMVVDAESILEEYFEESNQLFRIFEDGMIDPKSDFDNAPWRELVLIYLIGQRYAYEGGKADAPSLPYSYFYARVDVDESTVRSYMNKLDDDLIVEKDDESDEWKIVPDNLPKALSRIEGSQE
ncbi:hypothetical protein [Natronorubrum daqingense]|uniref:Uncharacterized protein n=1 Tax=Natronorubrum daqingense TaxID=588898 RepID=A0A1N6YAP5_9EURY|nr:hypothetical protein [Natronorubrum daqingense]APX95722.1 hypothetical protein BB347_03320 [Natronorubrum daqingense]SIR11657.1 hypothetical protein SAMN05421809_0380 [Natronorubrum daqingense]